MLTLDQIKNVTFTKVRGGYASNEVDDFIDQCVDTVAGLIEERNTSNKKLEVLADKLVEYRNEEDSIRSVLVNAQRLADSTVREANQKAALTIDDANIKAEKILADAQAKAKSEVESVTGEVDEKREELARLKREVTAFKNRMLSLYKEHLTLIDALPEEPAEPEPAVAEVTEPAVPAAPEKPAAPAAPVEETETPAPAEEPVAAPAEEPAETPAAPSAEEPAAADSSLQSLSLQELVEQQEKAAAAPKESGSRFGDLKFGDDYVIGEDTDSEGTRGFFRRKK